MKNILDGIIGDGIPDGLRVVNFWLLSLSIVALIIVAIEVLK